MNTFGQITTGHVRKLGIFPNKKKRRTVSMDATLV